jgi:hypothetical protein
LSEEEAKALNDRYACTVFADRPAGGAILENIVLFANTATKNMSFKDFINTNFDKIMFRWARQTEEWKGGHGGFRNL